MDMPKPLYSGNNPLHGSVSKRPGKADKVTIPGCDVFIIWENEIMGRILPNSLESPLIKYLTISWRLFVRFYWNTLSILQKERYQYLSLSPFRISTPVFSLGTNSGHSPLPSGSLKMSQRYWRGTLKETYFSMLYPNSKKSWALILQFSLPFIAKYEKLSEPYQEWNWRIENESLQLVLFLFGNPQRVLKAPGLTYIFQRRKNPCWSLSGAR